MLFGAELEIVVRVFSPTSILRVSGWSHRLVLTGVLYATAIPSVNGQAASPPDVAARRLSTEESAELRIDGLLDERAWEAAARATGFRQREPLEGDPATERTEVLVLFDDATLYIGIHAHDRSPEEIIARILQRDKIMIVSPFEGVLEFTSDDAIAILFDPFHDHRNGVIFGTNANGAEFDALITDEGREFNVDWRGVWEVAAQRTPEGWSAEFAIPFRTLRFPRASDEPWGFNVYRIIRRKNEEVLWSSWSRSNEGFERVSRAGHITGLSDLPRHGLNLELKPYALGGAQQERDAAQRLNTDGQMELGLDVKYEVLPGLLLDGTINTDFAQVEADDQQVNLTRFSLFFPEKRDFFLENAGIFEMGWRNFFEPPPFLLFFSRQIGISDDGAIPLLGGLRLTGRAGQQTVGLINVVTDEKFGEPRTNFAVARVKRDVGSANYIGAMATDRRNGDDWNSTGGLDWSFWPKSTLNIQGFAAATATGGAGGEGAAYRVGLDYQTDRFGVAVGHLGISPDATAEMGFVTRTDIQRSDMFVRVTPRPQILGLRKIDVFWQNQLITRFGGGLQDWQVGPAVSHEWNSGESLTVFYQRGFTRLDEGFDIGDDVPVPPGDYDTDFYGWFASTSQNRPVVLNSTAFFQNIYDGRVTTISGDVSLNPTANLALTVGFTHNKVSVPAGELAADLARVRLGYAFSTKVTFNALVQYNDQDDELTANLRFNFIHRPGSDLFIVINEERGSAASIWDVNTRAAVVKLTYLARL